MQVRQEMFQRAVTFLEPLPGVIQQRSIHAKPAGNLQRGRPSRHAHKQPISRSQCGGIEFDSRVGKSVCGVGKGLQRTVVSRHDDFHVARDESRQ